METILLVLHVLVAAAVIGFVLLQQGKGADMGAAFGSGSAGSFFGAAGSANFLSRSTTILATVFFVSSLGLSYLGMQRSGPPQESQGVMSKLPAEPAKDVPAAPVSGGSPAPESGKAKDIPN
ncbi:Protein-export membrane protein SecG [Burkholderiales bacterium]|nr:Protein-export membrane protein SecG [Burkholderiales bacterium]